MEIDRATPFARKLAERRGEDTHTLITFGVLAALLVFIMLAVASGGDTAGGGGGGQDFDPRALVTFPGAYEQAPS